MFSILAALLIQAPAVATLPPKPSVITQPNWLRKPTGADFANLYPKDAARENLEGRAVLHCRVTASGDLADCQVSDETPPGRGFGEAALAMAAKFAMQPQTKDGLPVEGGRVNIPINFRAPRPETAPSPITTLRCYGYAAAQAERDPASHEAQAAVFAFGVLVHVRLAGEHARPSEMAQALESQQHIAAGKLDDPAFKGERDECAVFLSSRAGANLERMAGVREH